MAPIFSLPYARKKKPSAKIRSGKKHPARNSSSLHTKNARKRVFFAWRTVKRNLFLTEKSFYVLRRGSPLWGGVAPLSPPPRQRRRFFILKEKPIWDFENLRPCALRKGRDIDVAPHEVPDNLALAAWRFLRCTGGGWCPTETHGPLADNLQSICWGSLPAPLSFWPSARGRQALVV